MDWKLEVVILPVSDVDRAKEFYAEKLGFHLDVDFQPSESFRVVQLTPPGSACSITFGIGLTPVQPGSIQGLHLVVSNLDAARDELVRRGARVSEPFHFGADGQQPGPHPEREDYGSYLSFQDPDGNGWLVQEVPSRDTAS